VSTLGVSGRPKNLIFASRGPKPEIGFADAINNDIIVLSGEESCPSYHRSHQGGADRPLERGVGAGNAAADGSDHDGAAGAE